MKENDVVRLINSKFFTTKNITFVIKVMNIKDNYLWLTSLDEKETLICSIKDVEVLEWAGVFL